MYLKADTNFGDNLYILHAQKSSHEQSGNQIVSKEIEMT